MTPAIPEELSSERQQSSEPAAEASSAEGKLLAQPAKLTKGMQPAAADKIIQHVALREEHFELSIPKQAFVT